MFAPERSHSAHWKRGMLIRFQDEDMIRRKCVAIVFKSRLICVFFLCFF